MNLLEKIGWMSGIITSVTSQGLLILGGSHPHLKIAVFVAGLVILVITGIFHLKSSKSQSKDSENKAEKKEHSEKILAKIFDHLRAIDFMGQNELELGVPIPLEKYKQETKIEDLTDAQLFDELYMKEWSKQTSLISNEYKLIPMKDNPENVEWGLEHLKHQDYKNILQYYKNTENKIKELNNSSKNIKITLENMIKEKIYTPFSFTNQSITGHLVYMIHNWIISGINDESMQKEIHGLAVA